MTDRRALSVRRVLMVVLGFVVVLLVAAVAILLSGKHAYGAIVVGIAVVVGVLGLLSWRAVGARSPSATRLTIATGAALCVLSVPLVPILVGLLTVVVGIGLLVVVLAPEQDAR